MDEIQLLSEPEPTAVVMPVVLRGASLVDRELLRLLRATLHSQGIHLEAPEAVS